MSPSLACCSISWRRKGKLPCAGGWHGASASSSLRPRSNGARWSGSGLTGGRSKRLSRRTESLGLRPRQLERAKAPARRALPVTHLAQEQATRFQVCGGERNNARDEVQAVAAAGERKPRLVPVFRGQCRHRARAHVRRVGQDQVVARRAQCGEKI